MRMGIIPKITCRNCGKQYSGLLNACPHCGAKRVRASGRAPTSTDGVTPGTSANAQNANNNKWQFIFGVIILAAVILAVIVLITVSLGDENPAATPTPLPTASTAPTPSPTPPPTPPPPPTPGVTSITITYAGQLRTEFLVGVGNTTPMSAITYPMDIEASVTWSSSDESIFTVDDNGVCTGVAEGKAMLYASCGAARSECVVYVRG